jgi:dTMP kinase
LVPDLTFFLDIPIREIEKRMNAIKSNKDRMESSGIEFYGRVREGYLQIAKNESRYRVVDGLQPIDQLHELIWQSIEELFVSKK